MTPKPPTKESMERAREIVKRAQDNSEGGITEIEARLIIYDIAEALDAETPREKILREAIDGARDLLEAICGLDERDWTLWSDKKHWADRIKANPDSIATTMAEDTIIAKRAVDLIYDALSKTARTK